MASCKAPTEYLPVSSSAHLALVPWLFGWDKPSFAFDVLVQLGTSARSVSTCATTSGRSSSRWCEA